MCVSGLLLRYKGTLTNTVILHCEGRQRRPLAAGRQRDEDRKRKFDQINNSIKSLSFVINGINLIQLEMKKCEALFSKVVLALPSCSYRSLRGGRRGGGEL